MKDIVVLKPGDQYYVAGFCCGFCGSDQKPIMLSSDSFDHNQGVVEFGNFGDHLNTGICFDCAEAAATFAQDKGFIEQRGRDKIRVPGVRRGDVTWREGVLEFDRDEWGYRIGLVPIGHQLTPMEHEAFGRGITLSWTEEESKNRKVLCPESRVDLGEVLMPFEGKVVKILWCEMGDGISQEVSDLNELSTRPDDPYVVWFSHEMPFVCPHGRTHRDLGHRAVVRGPSPYDKLRQLDSECPCGQTGHRQNLHKNKVALANLEALL